MALTTEEGAQSTATSPTVASGRGRGMAKSQIDAGRRDRRDGDELSLRLNTYEN